VTGLDVALVLLVVAVVLASVRIVRGPHDADRAVAADLVLFSFVGLTAVLGTRAGIAATFDLVLAAGLVGLLAALALGRLLTRGKR
jgi:multicomponent Na+:H+ antiporter subunit F